MVILTPAFFTRVDGNVVCTLSDLEDIHGNANHRRVSLSADRPSNDDNIEGTGAQC